MLKETILKQRADKDRLIKLPYVTRSKERYAKKWLSSGLIKVILGPRRAGKSVFALSMLKSQDFSYVNFDDESLSVDKHINLDELLSELHQTYGETKNILFDEIQNLPQWELFVNRLHRAGYNIIITGSNANLLSKELATHLTGRHIPIEILPFSFEEYLKAKKIEYHDLDSALPEEHARLYTHLNNFIISGGYPEIAITTIDSKEYLKILFESVLFKDIVTRNNIKDAIGLNALATYLINNITNQYTIPRLQQALQFKSVITLRKYIDYLTDSYFFTSLNQYSFKANIRIKSPKKIYATDNGIYTATAITHSPQYGIRLENVVFTELLKKNNVPNQHMHYFKTKNNKEVDFVLQEGGITKELIQVCYDISNKDTQDREVGALTTASKELGAANLTILTYNQQKTISHNNKTINCIPIIYWLLKKA